MRFEMLAATMDWTPQAFDIARKTALADRCPTSSDIIG